MVEPENALLSSIQKKGQHSYYYAHAPRQMDPRADLILLSGEGIVTGGPPVLIDQQAPTQQPLHRLVDIRNYSWADEDDKVTIYINFDEEVDKNQVRVSFLPKSLEVEYNFSENETRKLCLRKLFKEINPEASRYRVRRSRITLTLKKVGSDRWTKLTDTV